MDLSLAVKVGARMLSFQITANLGAGQVRAEAWLEL